MYGNDVGWRRKFIWPSSEIIVRRRIQIPHDFATLHSNETAEDRAGMKTQRKDVKKTTAEDYELNGTERGEVKEDSQNRANGDMSQRPNATEMQFICCKFRELLKSINILECNKENKIHKLIQILDLWLL